MLLLEGPTEAIGGMDLCFCPTNDSDIGLQVSKPVPPPLIQNLDISLLLLLRTLFPHLYNGSDITSSGCAGYLVKVSWGRCAPNTKQPGPMLAHGDHSLSSKAELSPAEAQGQDPEERCQVSASGIFKDRQDRTGQPGWASRRGSRQLLGLLALAGSRASKGGWRAPTAGRPGE